MRGCKNPAIVDAAPGVMYTLTVYVDGLSFGFYVTEGWTPLALLYSRSNLPYSMQGYC